MRTRCPGCQTVFRVTPEQLKARTGQVRCGHCQAVFNALDHLQDDARVLTTLPSAPPVGAPPADTAAEERRPVTPATELAAPVRDDQEVHISLEPVAPMPEDAEGDGTDHATAVLLEPIIPMSEAEAQDLGKATGLILPRETSEIPGYNKWAEGAVTTPFALPEDKPVRWPYLVFAMLLTLLLAGQAAFHFRSELAAVAPSLKPLLADMAEALGADVPLPRHVDLVSIESSDLQNDPAHSNLLMLNATLRNRARYGQAYPLLELSLTDTQDNAVARKVFAPTDYLPAKTSADQPFPANSDLAIHLWIDTGGITAAGYRLYVFYP